MSYVPGTVPASVTEGRRATRTIGCLDVGLVLAQKLDVHVGNRCSHPEPFDLKAMAIVARDEEQRLVSATLHDPRGEVAPLSVDAATHGRERFQFHVDEQARSICFDLRNVNRDAPEARPEPICFTRQDARWVVAR